MTGESRAEAPLRHSRCLRADHWRGTVRGTTDAVSRTLRGKPDTARSVEIFGLAGDRSTLLGVRNENREEDEVRTGACSHVNESFRASAETAMSRKLIWPSSPRKICGAFTEACLGGIELPRRAVGRPVAPVTLHLDIAKPSDGSSLARTSSTVALVPFVDPSRCTLRGSEDPDPLSRIYSRWRYPRLVLSESTTCTRVPEARTSLNGRRRSSSRRHRLRTRLHPPARDP